MATSDNLATHSGCSSDNLLPYSFLNLYVKIKVNHPRVMTAFYFIVFCNKG